MPDQHSSVIQLLRRVETLLQRTQRETASDILAKVIRRLSRTDDVAAELETLYSVQGFDMVALRLMSLSENRRLPGTDTPSDVIEYEVELLANLVEHSLAAQELLPSTKKTVVLQEVTERFSDTLHRLGTLVEEVKRKSFVEGVFRGIDPGLLYRIMTETVSLKQIALRTSHREVVRFAEAFSVFVHTVVDREIFKDVRVAKMVDNANLTLQTSLKAGAAVDYDSLNHAIELLQNPDTLLAEPKN